MQPVFFLFPCACVCVFFLWWYTYDVDENCPISKTPTPCPPTSEIFRPPWPWTSSFKRTSHPTSLKMITNQFKENMIQGWLLYVINKVTTELSFSVITTDTSSKWALARISAMASHRLPDPLHKPYPPFSHREWVERQESVDLVARAYDVWS